MTEITTDTIAALRGELSNLPQKEATRLSSRRAVELLLGEISAARTRGYLKSTLEATATGHLKNRIDDPLPWNFQPSN